jgi:hypothetical protein
VRSSSSGNRARTLRRSYGKPAIATVVARTSSERARPAEHVHSRVGEQPSVRQRRALVVARHH